MADVNDDGALKKVLFVSSSSSSFNDATKIVEKFVVFPRSDSSNSRKDSLRE
jgi:hypothetical protein